MEFRIIGGGLSGCEAAYYLAKRGKIVKLYEMRPAKKTPAHKTGRLAELVCSNSLKSEDILTAQGLLKWEMAALDSLVLKAGKYARVPAGGALAADREKFSDYIEKSLSEFPNLEIIREESYRLTENTIIAGGPLSSERLTDALGELIGEKFLSFYDAVAPIVDGESVDMERAFFAGRYGKGGEDYLNLPLTREEYYDFVDNLVSADRAILRDFDKRDVFDACVPIEIMAERGRDSLRFGPLRPVGLFDEDGKRPFAAVQLRRENSAGTLWNMVGFQTNLTFPEQKRVFSSIPALKNAEFVRYGVMHRNTFIDAPECFGRGFELKNSPKIFVAGQLSGVEGYTESAISGIISAMEASRRAEDKETVEPPITSAIGGLVSYLHAANGNFQPMHVGFALLPELPEKIRDKKTRKEKLVERAKKDFEEWLKIYN